MKCLNYYFQNIELKSLHLSLVYTATNVACFPLSLCGAKYFISLIDDSRYFIIVHFLKNKSQNHPSIEVVYNYGWSSNQNKTQRT